MARVIKWESDCGRATLYRGDCLAILPSLKADAVITDPPWGIDADTDYRRFVGGTHPSSDWGAAINGDSGEFDPTPFLGFDHVAMWGANCFPARLPVGRWLVWLKKRDNQLGKFMSDAELCWVKKKKAPRRAPGVYVMRHVWSGFDRDSERGRCLHPTQKPVAVMRWTIERAGVPTGASILDPFAGSGATGVAALELGHAFIGIENDPKHFRTLRQRVKATLETETLARAA